jgi:hypothetical protein
MNKAPNTSKQYFWHVKQSADDTVNRLTVVKLDDVKQLTLNIFRNVYLFGNAEVFISVILHKLCSYLLTLPTQVSGILFKDKGSNETILFYPCSKEPVKMINMTLYRANTLKKQRCSPCINQSYAFCQVFGFNENIEKLTCRESVRCRIPPKP